MEEVTDLDDLKGQIDSFPDIERSSRVGIAVGLFRDAFVKVCADLAAGKSLLVKVGERQHSVSLAEPVRDKA